MSDAQFLVYQSRQGQTEVLVRLEGETVWLSQQQMADLFQTTKLNISLHVKNVFSEGELMEDSVVKDYLTTESRGKRYHVLDAVAEIETWRFARGQHGGRNRGGFSEGYRGEEEDRTEARGDEPFC